LRRVGAVGATGIQSAYAAADGSLIQAQHAPGTDKLLPDDGLDGTSGA